MTGPEHYREAEQFAEASVYAYQKWGERGSYDDLSSANWQQGQAQVHATLALAAATALSGVASPPLAKDWEAWINTASEDKP